MTLGNTASRANLVRSSWLAPLACASSLALVLCGGLLALWNGTHAPEPPVAIFALASAAVGGVVAWKRPANPVGWLFLGSAFGILFQEFARQWAIYALVTDPGALPFGRLAAWVAVWAGPLGAALMLVILPFYFPDGRPVSPRWRLVLRLVVLALAANLSLFSVAPDRFVYETDIANPLGIEPLRPFAGLLERAGLVLWLGLISVAVASLMARFRRTGGDERQQLKWFVYAVTTVLVWFCVNSPVERAFPEVFPFLDSLVISGIPVAAGVAVLKYRLYDIDLLINRTLVYGALTVCVVGVYVLVVGYLAAVFRAEGNLTVSLLATGLLAVLFQPLRAYLQRGVDRLMYGERDEPYAVVSRLGERLGAALAPEAVLPAIVETVREALKLPYAAVSLPRDGRFEVAAASGAPPRCSSADLLVLPLSYGGETVGRLLLAPRAGERGFSAADRRLLDGLARHAGVAVNGVRAMNDLRRSREGLVLAREEERRRLRRDLHDDLAPTLAAMGLSAAAVGELIPTDPQGAASANEGLRKTIRATVGDVRRLVYDLRPSALDQLGLGGALKERATRLEAEDGGLRVTVEAPETLPPLPAAVEVAAYRIAQEALTNVSRHARAGACHVRLACPGGRVLEVEVRDDGVGLAERSDGGIGLHSMRERAEELGGTCEIGAATTSGTRVFARLPVAALPAAPPAEERG